MQILFLSQLIPYPADAGPKVRIYHTLQYLAQAGHQITLVAFRRDSDRAEDIAHLHQYCFNVHTVLMRRSRLRDARELIRSTLTGQPFLIRRDSVDEMYQTLSKLLAQHRFDAIHADQLWMAQYGLAARDVAGKSNRPMTVLDQHNAVHLIPKRLTIGASNPLKRAFLSLEAHNLARYELKTCRQFDHVVWVTEDDRAAMRQVANGQAPAFDDPVIPICVDPLATKPVKRSPQARRVTFLGGMHWPPNADGANWFAREIWPLILQEVPDAVLTVIGKNPPPALVTADGRLQNVDVTGYVADLKPYLEETAAFIVPLHAGGGMRVKIIDAWCWGLPVVSTPIGAEGLRYVDGKNLLLAENESEFVKAVVSLLKEPELGAKLSSAGRKTVETHYDWRKIYPAWDDIYKVTA